MRLFPWALALASALACSPANEVLGPVAGASMDAQAALLSVVEREPGVPGTESVLTVVLTDRSDACRSFRGGLSLNGSQALWLTLATVVPGGQLASPNQAGVHEVAPGRVVGGTRLAAAQFVRYGAACGVAVARKATAGVVALLHLDLSGDRAQGAVGTFELKLDSGEQLTGRFATEACETVDPFFVSCG